jgi:universal stress protein A
MAQIKRILVPTDFSAASEITLSYAMDLASRYGASLHLLHVLEESSFTAAYPDGFFAELPGMRTQMIEEGERRLGEAAARCADATLDVTTQVVVGRPARAIVQEAEQMGADLIVMGTHGRTGFAHLMLGSVAEQVLRTAPCPVLTVRDTARTADAAAAARVETEQPAPPVG